MSKKPTIEQLLDACEKPNCCACGWPWDAKAMVCGGCGFEPLAELSELRERLAAAERERTEAVAAKDKAVAEALEYHRCYLRRDEVADAACKRRDEEIMRRAAAEGRATRAEADGAAMRLIAKRAFIEGYGVGEGPADDDKYEPRALEVWPHSQARAESEVDHPGADLLAVVEAARKVTICHGAGVVGVEYEGFSATEIEDAYAHLGALSDALATYDARVQEGK